MDLFIKKLSSKVSDNLFLSYLIGFLAGLAVFFTMFVAYGFDLDVFTEKSFILGLIAISGVTVKFLGGVGISITYSLISAFIFKYFSSSMKSNQEKTDKVKLLVSLIAVGIFIYAFYILISSIFFTKSLSFLEKLISLVFGVWTLVIFVYVIPVVQGQYKPFEEESKLGKIKGKFGGFKYSMWRGYKRRVKKDYGSVYASEYERYKANIEDIRDQLSGFLLFPLSFILAPVMPLMGVTFVLWLRIFTLDDKPYNVYETLLLLAVLAVVLVLSTYIFLFMSISELVSYFNVFYALGIFSSLFLLFYVTLKH